MVPAACAETTAELDRGGSADVSAETVIVELARSLHASGAPAYELDQGMEEVAAFLGEPATFFSTPTSLFITFTHEEGHTRLLRVYPSDTNLGRYAELHETQRAIQVEGMSVSQAWRRIETLESTLAAYSPVLQVIAFGIASACFGVLVGGNATVVTSAGVIGLLTGGLLKGLGRWNYPTHLINIVVGLIACILASLVQFWVPSGNVELTSLAALIVLVPGLQLTISINELATQNLASGSARFAGAMMSLLTLVFGVYMGHALIHSWVEMPAPTPASTPEIIVSMASVIPLGLSLAVLFQARYRDIVWVVLSTLIGYGSLRLAGLWLLPFAAVWASAVGVGVCGHLISRWRHTPAAIMLMPALILLVPGSLGFFGLSAILLDKDLPGGIHIVSTMMLTSVAIVAGLLTTDVIVPPPTATPAGQGSETAPPR
ncbi:hypothetical protein CA85_15370 [Allorhodopirellula solitaria]|uniref:Threonine/serine exporter-like N-terminal domain-containing protein n=2 Tax=Allorhodopirellula solitaria TaxID=2527987 RepID=A0A5C5YEZ1_9BACT|nr:hypothetical protein CA85_15370 [Allorhodopirellula solitaria]